MFLIDGDKCSHMAGKTLNVDQTSVYRTPETGGVELQAGVRYVLDPTQLI